MRKIINTLHSPLLFCHVVCMYSIHNIILYDFGKSTKIERNRKPVSKKAIQNQWIFGIWILKLRWLNRPRNALQLWYNMEDIKRQEDSRSMKRWTYLEADLNDYVNRWDAFSYIINWAKITIFSFRMVVIRSWFVVFAFSLPSILQEVSVLHTNIKLIALTFPWDSFQICCFSIYIFSTNGWFNKIVHHVYKQGGFFVPFFHRTRRQSLH